jgi:vacuolar protein sorting-associated protein 26
MFGFSSNPTINISFNGQSSREKKKMKINGQEEEYVVYAGQEPVCGTVDIIAPSGKKVDHLGIKIEMIGHIGERLSSLKCSKIFMVYALRVIL